MTDKDVERGLPIVIIKRHESGFGYEVTVDGKDMSRCASAHIDINGPEPANVTFKIFAGADYFGEARLTVDVNEWPESIKAAVLNELIKGYSKEKESIETTCLSDPTRNYIPKALIAQQLNQSQIADIIRKDLLERGPIFRALESRKLR